MGSSYGPDGGPGPQGANKDLGLYCSAQLSVSSSELQITEGVTRHLNDAECNTEVHYTCTKFYHYIVIGMH